MPRPIHFELPADDPERAQAFYGQAFGWTFQKWDGPVPYWMVMTGEGDGINGGMGQRAPEFAQPVNVLQVDDLDAAIGKVESAGGTIVVPKMAVPTVGWLAYFHDTEGNMLGMMQFDGQAA